MRASQIGIAIAAIAGVLSFAAIGSAQGLEVGSTGAVTIEDTGADSTLLILQRPAATHAQMAFVTSTNLWNVRAHGSGGKFRIDEANTTGTSFDLTPAGALTLGGGLTANGNSTITGNLTVTGTINGTTLSSRALKTSIAAVDDREMLRRVANLPIYSWRYKAATNDPEQIGPMAEDVRDTLGLGDGTRLALGLTGGVSLSAIRGLNEIVQDNGRELAQLRETNAQLMDRLASLEARLAAER
jgi:hypothetical protein